MLLLDDPVYRSELEVRLKVLKDRRAAGGIGRCLWGDAFLPLAPAYEDEVGEERGGG